MSVINWLKKQAPGFGDLPPDDLNAIMHFSLLWSLFETRALNTNGNATAIVAAAKRWDDHSLLTQETFRAENKYFRDRYCKNEKFTFCFSSLHIECFNKKTQELVKRFLKNKCSHQWEAVAGLLLVIYRFRNNFFHGPKWAYDFRDQGNNFNHANAALMQAIELENARVAGQ
jgi:hypothetical protein